jgi:hypothetical protein
MLLFEAGGFYTEEQLRVRGLDGDALRRAREAGELRYRLLGRQVVYKGEWLNEWLGRPEVGRGRDGR